MSKNKDRIKTGLEERLASLEQRLAEMNATLRQPEDDDFEEQAADLDDDDVLERLSRASKTEIALIHAALKRLEEGTYGRCATCGKPISARRLQALPETEYCLSCAQSASRG